MTAQPLVSWNSNYGLLNQLRTLRKAGAIFTQVLMLTPSPGSKWYEDTYTSGCAFDAVGGKRVEPHIVDGNHVIASHHPRPWLKQVNLLAGYTYFFNPLRLLVAVFFPKSTIPFADAESRPADEVQQYSRWRKARRWSFRKVRAHMTDAAVQVLGMMALIRDILPHLGVAMASVLGPDPTRRTGAWQRNSHASCDGVSTSHELPGAVMRDTSHIPVPRTGLQAQNAMSERCGSSTLP